MTIKDRIAMMRAAAANQGYLKYASGQPPLTLTKTLAKLPESVTVHGASGGVGDDVNLFNGEVLLGRFSNNKFGRITSIPQHRSVRLSLPAGTYYLCTSVQIYLLRIVANNLYISSDLSRTITVTDDHYDIGWSFCRADGEDWNYVADKVWVVEGDKALPLSTRKIPIVFSDGTANKTINLYSDAALDVGDSLTVNSRAKTATRGSTDVSALQDWEQDWKIPKAEELTVTAGTTVAPSSMELAYRSKSKN